MTENPKEERNVRMRRYLDRLPERGLCRKSVTIPISKADELDEIVAKWREESK